MLKEKIKYYAVKLARPLVIFLPLNVLAALAYCLLAGKMDVVSYSNVLTVIGGAYFVIGGMGFMGGMSSEIDYRNNFSRNSNQRNADNANRDKFSAVVLTIGISTLLVSFAVLALQ